MKNVFSQLGSVLLSLVSLSGALVSYQQVLYADCHDIVGNDVFGMPLLDSSF